VTCTEFLALLDDLIDDSVTPEARAELQQHLRGCEHCEVTLNTTRKTIEIYRSHEIYDLPPASANASTPPSWPAAKKAAERFPPPRPIRRTPLKAEPGI